METKKKNMDHLQSRWRLSKSIHFPDKLTETNSENKHLWTWADGMSCLPNWYRSWVPKSNKMGRTRRTNIAASSLSRVYNVKHNIIVFIHSTFCGIDGRNRNINKLTCPYQKSNKGPNIDVRYLISIDVCELCQCRTWFAVEFESDGFQSNHAIHNNSRAIEQR